MKLLLGLIIFIVNIIVVGFTLYAAGSLGVSVFKNVNGECGHTTYQIEKYINGNWLCDMEASK